MSKAVNIIFPHQLFKESPLITNGYETYLIEEFLFFKQYNFHQQKLAFHRASMLAYKDYLDEKGVNVKYIDAQNPLADSRNFEEEISAQNISEIHVYDPCDFYLEKRLKKLAKNCDVNFYSSPHI